MSNIAELDVQKVPRHVAIVMDGNGRWAQGRKKPRLYGHKTGVDSVREIVETAGELGVGVLTLYAFSSENWKRPDSEVKGLMTLLKSYLQSELGRMLKNNIRLRCIGDLDRIPDGVRKILVEAIEKTRENKQLVLNLALSYGGRDEIVRAMRKIAARCIAGEVSCDDIDVNSVSSHLDTAGLPDPDLFIRTGGEKRLSNFLLWQTSYAEIIFTDIMWPEFRRQAFIDCLMEYQKRERRFGKTGAQVTKSS